jgi:hypothetical protein
MRKSDLILAAGFFLLSCVAFYVLAKLGVFTAP